MNYLVVYYAVLLDGKTTGIGSKGFRLNHYPLTFEEIRTLEGFIITDNPQILDVSIINIIPLAESKEGEKNE